MMQKPKKRNVAELIIAALQEKHLLTAPDLLEVLEKKSGGFNKTSIYRALDRLLDQGEICRHHLNDGTATFELRSHHHAHVVCQTCGAVATVDCEYEHPQQAAGFAIDHHHLTLLGLCSDCQAIPQN